ncbi:MAG: Single-stranded DNA-binding protein [Chloroflexi bacterium]|nr:Single-stranded DNA-binding protein [Chloroflexota bacterium]
MYQKITIVGNLGRDPEMRYTPSGQAVTNINVATNRRWTTNDGERAEETTWFRVSVWGSQGEAVNQWLRQGSRVLVEGRLRPDPETGSPRIWTRQDGTPGASFEITARRVVFLSSKAEDEAYQAKSGDSGGPAPVQEDEIPF